MVEDVSIKIIQDRPGSKKNGGSEQLTHRARMVVTSGCQSHGHHQKFIALLILCFLDCGQGDGKGEFGFVTLLSRFSSICELCVPQLPFPAYFNHPAPLPLNWSDLMAPCFGYAIPTSYGSKLPKFHNQESP
ncbi:hypothetical protein QTP88_018191 [Uroleucon formosanum]